MRLFYLLILISSSALIAPHVSPLIVGETAAVIGAFLFLRRWRVLAISGLFIAVNLIYFQARLPEHIIPKTCKTQAYLTEFPRAAYPVGSRFSLHLMDDCQAKKDVFVVDYSKFHYELGVVYDLEINFKNSSGTIKNRVISAQKAPFLLRYRAFLAQKIENLYRIDNQSWVKALILGDRSRIHSQDAVAVQRNGTAHIIAISGFHLGLFAAVSYWLCLGLSVLGRWYLPCSPRTAALFGALIMSGTYSLIAGANPPVVRSWLMLVVLTLHWLFPIIQTGRQVLILAAIMQIYLFPEDLHSASAWLSYAAVAIIMVAMPRLKKLSLTLQFVALQTFITIAMLPLTWALFGGMSLVAIPTNLILLPFTPFLLYVTFLSLFLSFLAPIADFFTTYYVAALRFWGELSFAYIEFNFQPPVISGLATTALIILFFSRFEQKKWLAGFLVLTLITAFFKPLPERLEIPSRYPLAMIISEGKIYLINAGAKKSSFLRDDFRRHFLPILRTKMMRPEAVVLTTKAIPANTALSTILKFYPETKIYSLVQQHKNFPFDYELVSPPLKIGSFQITVNGLMSVY